MKKMKLVIAAVLSLVVLAACGGNSDTKDSSAAKTESALDAIKEKGKLVVGTSADFAPFEFKTLVDGKDTIVGSDIDMVKAIGEKLGVEVEFMDMQFDAVLVALQQNKVDIAVSGISATAERKKSFDFSTPYYNPPQK